MSCRSTAGFTLVELVVILLIVGVLAVSATARLGDIDQFGARGFGDELVSATRFAQRYAVASGCTVRITINAGGYSITTQDAVCGFGTAVQAPGGSAFVGAAPSGVSVVAGTGSYDFSATGDTGAGGVVNVQGGGSNVTFTITAASGFVQ